MARGPISTVAGAGWRFVRSKFWNIPWFAWFLYTYVNKPDDLGSWVGVYLTFSIIIIMLPFNLVGTPSEPAGQQNRRRDRW